MKTITTTHCQIDNEPINVPPRGSVDAVNVNRAGSSTRAGSSLVVDAVTGNDQFGRPGKRKRDGAATASGIDHRIHSLPELAVVRRFVPANVRMA
jgi:hypothetical protein